MSPHPPRAGKAAVAAALVLVQVFFGVHYLAAKILLQDVPPRAWAVLRVVSAAAVLLGACIALRRSFPRDPRDLGRLALFSIFGVVLNQICFVEGLSRTTPTHSAILNTTIPVGTLLFALLLGREILDGGKILSILLALGGVLLVVHPERAAFGSATLVGDLLTLVNALSYGFFLVISKRVLARMDPLAATAVLMSFGALGILAAGAPSLAAADLSAVPLRTWGLGAFIVLFPTVGAYYLTYWALARVESSTVALFVYLQPVIAAALSALVLGERLTARVVAGATLVFLGVYVAVGHPRLRAAVRARGAAPEAGDVP